LSCVVQEKNASDTPLDIETLTIADLGEHVVCTPRQILLHPAYHGGWKVLRSCREDGRVDLVMTHSFLSFFVILSISVLYEIFSMF
jgi:hypothetical protein